MTGTLTSFLNTLLTCYGAMAAIRVWCEREQRPLPPGPTERREQRQADLRMMA